MLRDSHEEFFSGVDQISSIDIMLHSEISTIVYMYSLKEKLSEKEYPHLSAWMNQMGLQQCISDHLLKMKEIIQRKRMYGDFIKS
mmetsp:Transcript_6064/g.9772  ORF Transcript_6064/g.9772 Transcript_6064/m.9772 type:complete len:85 (+) Transcript_6064:516-770(+)